MKKKKLRVVVDSGFNGDYLSFLEKKFEVEVIKYSDLEQKSLYAEPIDLLVFTGGADVDPSLYNENIGKNTSINTKRDDIERDMFYKLEHIPKLGICRGSQFLTVMAGGKLVQHVTGHTSSHSLHLNLNGRSKVASYNITSTHHQMMFPFNLSEKVYEILAWSKRFQSTTYLNGKNEEIVLPNKFVEPEIVYYPKILSLCVQGHPEFKSCSENTALMILNLIENKLLINNKQLEPRW